ncbi:TPA: hypothetical protein ACIVDT_005237, partial [Salmonella enterica subsp. enterica serovar Eastbourne]
MFFKTSNPAALAAWDQYQLDCQKVRAEAKELEAALGCGGRALFRVDVA